MLYCIIKKIRYPRFYQRYRSQQHVFFNKGLYLPKKGIPSCVCDQNVNCMSIRDLYSCEILLQNIQGLPYNTLLGDCCRLQVISFTFQLCYSVGDMYSTRQLNNTLPKIQNEYQISAFMKTICIGIYCFMVFCTL